MVISSGEKNYYYKFYPKPKELVSGRLSWNLKKLIAGSRQRLRFVLTILLLLLSISIFFCFFSVFHFLVVGFVQ